MTAKMGDEPIAPTRLDSLSRVRIVIAIARVAVVNVKFSSRMI